MRHGPHHGAQKSMSTGTFESRTFSLKSVSLTGPAAGRRDTSQIYEIVAPVAEGSSAY